MHFKQIDNLRNNIKKKKELQNTNEILNQLNDKYIKDVNTDFELYIDNFLNIIENIW